MSKNKIYHCSKNGFSMLKLWIEEDKMEKPDYPDKMEFYEFQEIEITMEIKKDISKRVLLGLENPKYLQFRFNNLNSGEIRKYLINHILPDKNVRFSPRKSKWGEIISAEILTVFRKHLIPIYRLRYKEKKDQAMRGEADVVTCYLDDDPLIIAFTEVKTKSDIKGNINEYKKEMQNAETGLLKNNVEKPEVLEYICKRLFDEKKYSLLQKFDEAFNNPYSYKKEFHIFMIMEKSRWGEQIIDFFKETPTELPNLTIDIVLINSLDDLIDETYEIILDIAEDVINDF